MKTHFNPNNNPRVIIIQKLYGKFINEDNNVEFPKHRFKKFIKDIVSGTIERNDIILEELDKNLGKEFTLDNLDKLFQVILKSATYEFLYKPNLSIKTPAKNLPIHVQIALTIPKRLNVLSSYIVKPITL